MRRENIHQNYPYITTQANVANSASPIAILTIPAGRVYKMQDGTPLVLKLYTSGGAEISRNSKVWIAWQPPVGETKYQAGRTMNYGIFRRISITDQENINTEARRLIEFDDEEIARAQRGEISLITGLTADYKIILMLESADTVDWTQSGCEFNFDLFVMTEQEYLAQRTGKPLPVYK
jgi:hypothetical protein